MDAAAHRIGRIRSALQRAFAPIQLEIIDESHLHAGHEGAKDGKGHFRVKIISAHFQGRKPLECHRMVFEALETMLDTDIHALSVTAVGPTQGAISDQPKQEDKT
jgi:BolA protein